MNKEQEHALDAGYLADQADTLSRYAAKLAASAKKLEPVDWSGWHPITLFAKSALEQYVGRSVSWDTSAQDAAEMRADMLQDDLTELADKYELLTRRYCDLKQQAECEHLRAQMEEDVYQEEDVF